MPGVKKTWYRKIIVNFVEFNCGTCIPQEEEKKYLGGELLPGGLSSSRFASGLLRTSHSYSKEAETLIQRKS